MECVNKETGICILEWTKLSSDIYQNELDSFGANKIKYMEIININ